MTGQVPWERPPFLVFGGAVPRSSSGPARAVRLSEAAQRHSRRR